MGHGTRRLRLDRLEAARLTGRGSRGGARGGKAAAAFSLTKVVK
jgi:hypothetical protein